MKAIINGGGVMRRLRVPLLFTGLCLVAPVGSALGAVPNPTVSGPIPVNVPLGDPSHDYPQLATQADLAGNGYVEEEYFFEGTANEYDVISAPLSNATIRSAGNPYKTRMIVRRPTSAAKFNGVVLVEWLNVTSGYNLDALWLLQQDHLMREGFAYVGVSVQRVGVQNSPTSLTSWSPIRYGSLDVTSGGKFVQANAGGPNASDALSFDIMAQAGQAVKHPIGVDPLGGLPGNRTVLASGVSQSEGFLVSYYNSVHARDPVYDGFFLYLGISRGAYGAFRLPLRTDLPTKLFKVNTENDVLLLGEHLIRQPDSDKLHTWEIAGASHVGFDPRGLRAALLARDGIPPASLAGCTLGPPLSHIPAARALNAALNHTVRWVQDNVAPPAAPRIELTSVSPVPPPPPTPFAAMPATAARDSDGNALGGLRLSQHSVPTATNTGVNAGPGFCILFGTHAPFSEERLAELYRNHGSYVSKVAQATDSNLKAGYIVAADAEQDKEAAGESDIGK
ncbi:MAG: alpha/beta hydrolase domain-containing protein [Sulfurifustis sp.]